MRNSKNKTSFVLSFIALAFILTLSSCAKKEVQKNIEGSWTVQEFLVDGDIFFQPSPDNSIVWTFTDGTLTGVTTYLDGLTPVVETDQGTYTIKNRGKTLEVDSGVWSINELTSSKLILESTSNGETAIITYSK